MPSAVSTTNSASMPGIVSPPTGGPMTVMPVLVSMDFLAPFSEKERDLLGRAADVEHDYLSSYVRRTALNEAARTIRKARRTASA